MVDLKTGKVKPEYAGKMNFYLSAVDDKLKTEKDHPSIGIIICKEKSKVVAEYALRDRNKPMGITEYKIQNLCRKKSIAVNLSIVHDFNRGFLVVGRLKMV